MKLNRFQLGIVLYGDVIENQVEVERFLFCSSNREFLGLARGDFMYTIPSSTGLIRKVEFQLTLGRIAQISADADFFKLGPATIQLVQQKILLCFSS